MLDVPTYADALLVGGLSKQTFNLIPKIRELDALMTPERQRTVVEAHPELGFARLRGEPCLASKRTVEGREERRALIRLSIERPPRGAAWDDVLDACALVPTARRLRTGTVARLGDGTTDVKGLRCEIVL